MKQHVRDCLHKSIDEALEQVAEKGLELHEVHVKFTACPVSGDGTGFTVKKLFVCFVEPNVAAAVP